MQLLPEVHVYYYHRSYWAIIMPDSEQRDKTHNDNKNTHTPKTRGQKQTLMEICIKLHVFSPCPYVSCAAHFSSVCHDSQYLTLLRWAMFELVTLE